MIPCVFPKICVAYAFEARLLELFLVNLMANFFKEFGPILDVHFRKMTIQELVEAEATTLEGKSLRKLTLEELLRTEPAVMENQIAGVRDAIFVYIWSDGDWVRRTDIELNSQPEF